MHKAPIAEWLLTQASTPQRASEIVGDLLEQRLSPVRFWLTIARVFLALTWRWTLGAVLAGLSFFAFLAPFSLLVAPRRNDVINAQFSAMLRPAAKADFEAWQQRNRGKIAGDWLRTQVAARHASRADTINDLIKQGSMAPREASEPWMLWEKYLDEATVCFGTMVGFTLSRYGFRDRLTRISAMVWGALVACDCCLWMPHALYVAPVLLVAGAAALLLSNAARRPFLCILGPTAAFAATLSILLLRINFLMHASELLGGSLTIVVWLIGFAIEAIVLTRLRPVLLHETVSA